MNETKVQSVDKTIFIEKNDNQKQLPSKSAEMEKVLVIGSNGQDGRKISERLAATNYQVLGIGRQQNPAEARRASNFDYIQLDISNGEKLLELLGTHKPRHIFHTAAVHGPSGFNYEAQWDVLFEVNTKSVLVCLEYLKQNPDAHLHYFSSSKVFPLESGTEISEASPQHPSCLYTVSKICAQNVISYYRKKYDVQVSIFWTFNHDSLIRSRDYFLPKLAHAIAYSLKHPRKVHTFKSLNFWGNWMSAEEVAEIIVGLALKNICGDFVVASSKSYWARDLIAETYASYSMNWKEHVHVLEEEARDIPSCPKINTEKLKAVWQKGVRSNAETVLRAMIISILEESEST